MKKQQRLMGGALNRMRKYKMSQAWEQWQFWYEELMRSREVAMKCMKWWRNKELGAGFFTWQIFAQGAKEQKRLMGGALNRMKKYKMSQAWEQWQFWYEEFCRSRDIALRAAARWKNRELGAALYTWQVWYEEKKEALRKLKQGLMRFMKRAQSMAFQSWVSWYEHLMWQKRACEKVAARWRNRHVSMAFNAWRILPIWLKEVTVILDKAGKRWGKIRLFKGWNSWYHHVQSVIAMRHQMDMSRDALKNVHIKLHHKQAMSRELAAEYKRLEEAVLLAEDAELKRAESLYEIDYFKKDNINTENVLRTEGKPPIKTQNLTSSWDTKWRKAGEWQPVYNEVQAIADKEKNALRAMFVLSVFHHLHKMPHQRAFKVWAGGEMDYRELLANDIQDLCAGQKKLLSTFLRPVV